MRLSVYLQFGLALMLYALAPFGSDLERSVYNSVTATTIGFNIVAYLDIFRPNDGDFWAVSLNHFCILGFNSIWHGIFVIISSVYLKRKGYWVGSLLALGVAMGSSVSCMVIIWEDSFSFGSGSDPCQVNDESMVAMGLSMVYGFLCLAHIAILLGTPLAIVIRFLGAISYALLVAIRVIIRPDVQRPDSNEATSHPNGEDGTGDTNSDAISTRVLAQTIPLGVVCGGASLVAIECLVAEYQSHTNTSQWTLGQILAVTMFAAPLIDVIQCMFKKSPLYWGYSPVGYFLSPWCNYSGYGSY